MRHKFGTGKRLDVHNPLRCGVLSPLEGPCFLGPEQAQKLNIDLSCFAPNAATSHFRNAQLYESRPFVDLHIHDIPIRFLVDSGATRSILSETLFKSIPLHEDFPPALHMPKFKVRGVTGHKINLVGTFMLPISFGDGYEKTFPILVVEGIVQHALLGVDILAAEKAIIDAEAKKVRFPNVPSSWATPNQFDDRRRFPSPIR